MANVVGTANLFAAIEASALDLGLVIVASSAKVYANPDPPSPITEDSPLDPKSHYSISKRTVEDIALLSADRFPVILARPFNYTGPGQTTDFLVPKIVQHFLAKKPEIRLGELDLYRDFSDVRRVVEAYTRLAAGHFHSTIVNICSGRKLHLQGIVSTMREISGHDLRVVADAALMRSGEPREIWGSSVKLEGLVGELPNPEFRETLKSMYDAGRQASGP
jgi:nucleoside-diphosphate-sugar epimerase